eukprot:jgi/Botrbrau1/8656/Bobra.0087s0010.1
MQLTAGWARSPQVHICCLPRTNKRTRRFTWPRGRGQAAFVQMILRSGAPWDAAKAAVATNKAGQTPLHFAAAMACPESAAAILKTASGAGTHARQATPKRCSLGRKKRTSGIGGLADGAQWVDSLFNQSQLAYNGVLPKTVLGSQNFHGAPGAWEGSPTRKCPSIGRPHSRRKRNFAVNPV